MLKNGKQIQGLYMGNKEITKVYSSADLVWEKPSKYTPCLYLESSGNQYINTGVKNGNGYTIDIEFSRARAVSSYNWVFGCQVNSYKSRLQLESSGNNHYFTDNSDAKRCLFSLVTGTIYKLHVTPTTVTLADNTIDYKYNASGEEVDIHLFGANFNGSHRTSGNGLRIYKYSIDADGYCQNFVPALDPSGKPCMYDTVSEQAYYNSGTGEFGYELEDGTYVAPV